MPAAIKFVARMKSRWRTTVKILCVLGCCMTSNGYAAATTDSAYIGSQTCAECHRAEYDNWQGSHHDLAMQIASATTVLGDFDDVEFTQFGVTSTFFRQGEKFLVRTDGADGSLQVFEILYTFGVYPLQQYLVEFSGGRMQALSIAWDARPQNEGGQRWFHLYPDEKNFQR